VSRRLEQIYDLARKHRVMPEQVHELQGRLTAELEELQADDVQLETLEGTIADSLSHYQTTAKKLSTARKKAAKKLAERVMVILGSLAMERCQFVIDLTVRDDAVHPAGAESVNFLISTNPGSSPGPLAKIASGGELSRISLALQVAAADSVTAPTMIFDEVDVGIGGAVAEVVGSLLRSLSERAQVLCVTHLPQVAAKGHQQLRVSKCGDDKSVSTTLEVLTAGDRVEEIARMLGGLKITENTRSHAKEILEAS
jgi:DNA repair protein RecN (Recombination protein N)